MNEQDIKKVINHLSNSIHDENLENFPDFVKTIKEIGIKNPETFNLLVCYKTESVINAALNSIFEKEPKKHRLIFLYSHYDYLNSHIADFMCKTAGHACSVDRARHILKGYKEYLQTGKEFAIGNRKDYWVPPFGSSKQWIAFVEALEHTYYHFPDKRDSDVFEDIAKAAKAYQEKREEEELAYIKERDNTIIDFNMIMDLKTPILVTNTTQGRMFCELFDTFLKDETDPHKNIREYYLSCDPDTGDVITISGGLITSTPYTKWQGPRPVPFKHVTKRKEN